MKRPFILFLLVLSLIAFGAGLFQIFQLRFEAGDVYPEYSSLRSDPLGTMALCESLEKMPGVSVRRDYSAPVSLRRILREILLMIIFRHVELFERYDFSDNGRVPDVFSVQLCD